MSETSTSGLAGLSDEELVRRMLAAQIKAAETLSVGRNGRLTKRLASIDDNIRTLEARIESNMRVIEATKDDSGKRSLERTNGLIAEEIRENRELRQRLDEEVVKLKSTLADGQRRLVEQVSIVNAQIESAKVSAKAAQDLAEARAKYAKVVQFIRLTLVKTIQQIGTCEQNRQALAFANATPDEQFRIELNCDSPPSLSSTLSDEIIEA